MLRAGPRWRATTSQYARAGVDPERAQRAGPGRPRWWFGPGRTAVVVAGESASVRFAAWASQRSPKPARKRSFRSMGITTVTRTRPQAYVSQHGHHNGHPNPPASVRFAAWASQRSPEPADRGGGSGPVGAQPGSRWWSPKPARKRSFRSMGITTVAQTRPQAYVTWASQRSPNPPASVRFAAWASQRSPKPARKRTFRSMGITTVAQTRPQAFVSQHGRHNGHPNPPASVRFAAWASQRSPKPARKRTFRSMGVTTVARTSLGRIRRYGPGPAIHEPDGQPGSGSAVRCRGYRSRPQPGASSRLPDRPDRPEAP